MRNIIVNIFIVLLFLVTIQGSIFYLVKLKVKFIEWLFFNPCAISNIVFLIGFIIAKTTGNRIILHTAILPMFFFGTLGMFFLPWKGMNIIPQIAHIIMTVNIFLTLHTTIAEKDYRLATIGLLVSIIVFAPFIGLQQKYKREHPKRFEEILININV